MSICYYFLNFLWNLKCTTMHFRRHWLFVNMPYTKKNNFLLNNLFDLKGYNGQYLVSEYSSKGWNVGLVYQLLQKLRFTGLVVPAAADDAAPGQLIVIIDLADKLVLHKNGQAINNICTLYLILWPYRLQRIIKSRSRHSIQHDWKDPNSGVHVSTGSAETL